jgi:N-hydroxyarylamine O-acetyltransferase
MSMEFDRKKYLRRIGLEETEPAADAESLKLLQRRHLLTIPFENLDIHWKRPILLDTDAFYRKIVGENRGGFCYELNGLFNVLLKDLGFETKMVSARVGRGEGVFSPAFAHMAIIVKIEGEEYIADVGFGEFTAEPLKFILEAEQQDPAGTFRIAKFPFEDKEYFEIAKKDESEWRSENIFDTLPRELSEYSGMCDFQQTSPESNFVKKKICSLMTEDGRKTLTSDTFIVTKNGERTETPVTSAEQFNEILKREFNIVPLN